MHTLTDSTLVATLAGGPQIVTFALDDLLQRGEAIHHVLAVHLSPQADPLTAQALARLSAEFLNGSYKGRPCCLEFFLLRSGEKKIDDIMDETAANAAWSALYELMARLKTEGRHLHVCVAGGRRMLALLMMSAAMLHFDHQDCLWHMYTPGKFLERARDGAIMHARPQDGVRLIQVPIAPWGAYFPALRTLTQPSPLDAIAAQTRQIALQDQEHCRAVVGRLTAREREVLRELARGALPQVVAERLSITLKTVHTHKTRILTECRNEWGLGDTPRLDYHFLKEKFHWFFEQG